MLRKLDRRSQYVLAHVDHHLVEPPVQLGKSKHDTEFRVVASGIAATAITGAKTRLRAEPVDRR
jgi:hypothetical protein